MTNQLIQTLGAEQKLVTTSLQVAETFGKQHKNVLRDINNLVADMGKLGKLSESSENFIPDTYVHERSKQSFPMYYITEEGFTLLAMGFNGTKALEFKLAYIEAFQRMREQLKAVVQHSYTIEDPIERAKAWILEQEKLKKVEENNRKIREQSVQVLEFAESVKPAVVVGQKLLDSLSDIKLKDFATTLQATNVVSIGRTRLYGSLRDGSFITKQNPIKATQKSIDLGIMYNTPVSVEKNGRTINTFKVMVTPKGVEYFIRFYLGKSKVNELKAINEYEALLANFKAMEEEL